MKAFESYVAERYLKTRKKGAFVRTLTRYARWGIGLGVFVLVVAQALMNGFREEIQANLFTATGHFTVNYYLGGDIPDTPKALGKIRAIPGVVAASPMRMERGLMKSSNGAAPTEAVMAKGIDPRTAHGTSSIFDSLKPNPVEQLQEGEVLVGRELAKNIDLRQGDTVSITFMRGELSLSGIQPKIMGFKVAGIFDSHISEYDKSWVFIHLEDAKRLAQTDQAEFIEVRASSINAIDTVKPAALMALSGGAKKLYNASDLRDTNRSLFSALEFQKYLFGVILAFIVVLAAFNIVAILVLFIAEKRRDLGVLLALGATPRQIQRIFELQGVRICAVGTAWGMGLAVPTCWIADHWKLFALPPALYDFITYVPFKLSLWDLAAVAIFPLLVAWAASRYPARRAAEVNPVDALRSE